VGTTLLVDSHRREQAARATRTLRLGSGLPAILAAALGLAACGGGSEPKAPVADGAPAKVTPAAPSADPSTAAVPLAPKAATASGTHDLYAQRGFTCEACHPCGRRDPNGHGLAWMDQANPGFHAYASSANLSSCQPCHGAALDGVGSTTGAPPKTVWGRSADAVRVGTHAAHLQATHGLAAPVACSNCHVLPASALSTGHSNGATADVAFSGLAVQGAPTAPSWNRTAATRASP
jgi:hypothetical protein